MAELPAICPKCGDVVGSGIVIGEGSATHISNVVTLCPRCKVLAVIPSGEYSTAGQALRVIAHSTKDEALLRQIQRLMQSAVAGAIPDKGSLENELRKAGVPDAAKIVASAPSGDSFVAWAALIVGVIALILTLPAGIRDWRGVFSDLSRTYPELRGTLD